MRVAAHRFSALLIFSLVPVVCGNAAHLFQADILYPNNGSVGDVYFGIAVALSFDETRALVGATVDDGTSSDTGAAYLFEQTVETATNWSELAVLYPATGPGSQFGWAVDLSSDGTRALVSAFGVGAVYVMEQAVGDPTNWTTLAVLNRAGSFGSSVALSPDGTRALVGAYNDGFMGAAAGAVYVFDQIMGEPNNWTEQTILYPRNGSVSSQFGSSVAMSSDGTRVLIGAPSDDTIVIDAGVAYLFDQTTGDPTNWTELAVLYPNISASGGRFGNSVALSSDGTRGVIGAVLDFTLGTTAGAAYVIEQAMGAPNNWTVLAPLYPSNSSPILRFGSSVALSSDGKRSLIGALGARTMGLTTGAVYVMEETTGDPTNWTEIAVLYPSIVTGSPEFGTSVALSSDGRRAVVGARFDDTVSSNAGAAYVFGPCLPNEISNANQTMCVECPVGLVPNAQQTMCVECPAGQVPNSGETMCVVCPVGRVPNANQTLCVDCPVGQVPNANQTMCVNDVGDSSSFQTSSGASQLLHPWSRRCF